MIKTQQFNIYSRVNMMKIEADEHANYTISNEEDASKRKEQAKQSKQLNNYLKFYSWDYRENYTYITYLNNFRGVFSRGDERRKEKIYTHISKLLTTRNSHQIKTHHEKMIMRHKDIDGIIDYLRQNIIKHIKKYPESVKKIELINQQCQAFFMKQSGQVRTYPSGEEGGKMRNGMHLEQKVKIEENQNSLTYKEFTYEDQMNRESSKQIQPKVQNQEQYVQD